MQAIIISGPSGAGKSSLVKALFKSASNDLRGSIWISVSHTTRTKRQGEQEGVNYYYVSKEEFADNARRGRFLESAEVFGNLYGTSLDIINEKFAQEKFVILEIDCQGARQVRSILEKRSYSIFIKPPSISSLNDRLRERNQDDEKTIENRLNHAQHEISQADAFDLVITNDDFDVALLELTTAITKQIDSVKQKMKKETT